MTPLVCTLYKTSLPNERLGPRESQSWMVQGNPPTLYLRTIVKPLWQLLPSEAKNPPKMTQDCKNVALKLPKISLSRDILGNLRATFFAVLGHFCFLLRLGGCGSQGLYNRSSLYQPFANLSPTFCQPFANLFCQPLSKPLFPCDPRRGFRNAGRQLRALTKVGRFANRFSLRRKNFCFFFRIDLLENG